MNNIQPLCMTSPPPQVLSSPTDDPLHLTNQPFKYLEEEECKFGLFGVSQFSSCETCWSNRDKICHKQDLKFIQAAGSQTNGTNAFIMPESYEHPPVKDYSKEVGKLFIGGLPNGLSDPDLKENFSKLAEKIVKSKYGHQFASSSELLDDCIVITDTERKPRGFGFVRFRYPLLAIEVLEAFGSYGKLDKNNNIITHYAEHFNLGDPAKKIEIKPCSPKDHPVKKQLNPDMYARQVPTNESGSDSDQPDIEKMVIVSLYKETTTVEQVEHVMRFYGLIKSIERKSSYSVQIEYAHKQSVKLTSTLKTFKCNGATIEVKPLEFSLPRGPPFVSQGITQSRETKSMPEQLNFIQKGIENMRTRENVGRFSISSPNNLNNFMMHKRSEMNANQPWLLPNIPEEMIHNMLYLHKCDWLIDVSLSPYQYVDQRETQQRIKTWHQMLPVLHDFQSIFCRKEQLFLKYGMDMVKLVIKLRETMTKWSFSNNSLDELTKRYLKWLPKYKEIQREKIAMEKTETFQYEECSSNKIDANKINCIFGWSSEDGSNCQICAANSKYLILTPESNTEAMYNITGVPEELGKLFVGGLNGETSKETLFDHFSQFGEIIDCVISVDKSNNNKSKGFGFVRFKYPKKAVACLAEYKRYKHNLNVLQSLLYASGKDSRALEYQVEIVRAQRKKFVLDDRNLDVKPCKVKLDGTIPMLDENAADEKKRCIHIYIEPIRNFINDTDVLEHLFTAFGVIEKCRIHKDRKWAFIEFAHWESARLAVSFDRKLSFGPALSSGKMHNTIQIGQVHENTNLNDSKFLSPNCEFDLNSPYLTAKVESNVGPRLKFGKNPEKLISYSNFEEIIKKYS